MTEIMPSLQNLIKLSYDSPGLPGFFQEKSSIKIRAGNLLVRVSGPFPIFFSSAGGLSAAYPVYFTSVARTAPGPATSSFK